MYSTYNSRHKVRVNRQTSNLFALKNRKYSVCWHVQYCTQSDFAKFKRAFNNLCTLHRVRKKRSHLFLPLTLSNAGQFSKIKFLQQQ